MARCEFKNSEGECIPPGDSTGPSCTFRGSDYARLCAVHPLHVARKKGRPMSASEATRTAYARGLAQELENRRPKWAFWRRRG
jgi:hypothetical protein